jgi:hypothetical protein
MCLTSGGHALVDTFLQVPATRTTFRALAATIVPQATSLTDAQWAAADAVIHDALLLRPARMRRQLALFIRVVDVLPVLRWGRTFRQLDAERRVRMLSALERSPLLLVRRGFWGVRTLVFMGYYGRPDSHEAIGYDARLRGWLEHPAAPAAARQRTLAAAEDDA